MNLARCDVVIQVWPFASGVGRKMRPALVVQNDLDNRRLANTIVVMITSRVSRANEPSQLMIDISTPEGKQTGLRQNSVINCVNLFTIDQTRILHVIGSLPTALILKVDDCLKTALGLP